MNARDRFTLISLTPASAAMTMELFQWSGRAGTLNPGDVAAWVTELDIVATCVGLIRPGYVVIVRKHSKVKDVVHSTRGTNLRSQDHLSLRCG